MTAQAITLNNRERATLKAVGQGRAEITCSCEPDLYVDGIPCCDQFTARRLARAALVVPLRGGPTGARVPAMLTDTARSTLGLAAATEAPQAAA